MVAVTLDKIDLIDRKFSKTLLGYRPDAVDRLVAEAADTIGRLAEEKMALTRTVEELRREVEGYRSRETTLRDTLLTTQTIVEDVKAKAKREAEGLLDQARDQADALVRQAREQAMMTITTEGDEAIIEQIVKQLRKLVTTLKVVDLTRTKAVEREMMLLRVDAEGASRAEVLRIVDIFRCKVVDVSPSDLIIEVTGTQDKLMALVSLLQRFGIKEVARTGAVAMRRGMQE